MRVLWQVVDGKMRIPHEEAEWFAASLAVLVAAIHHPDVLATGQPGTDPAEMAREVLADLGELQAAAVCADQGSNEARDRSRSVSVRRDGGDLAFSPGAEIANLAWCLHIFATAALEPGRHEGAVARGATAYAASAWSRDIGLASGAREAEAPRRTAGTGAMPRAVRAARPGPATADGGPRP